MLNDGLLWIDQGLIHSYSKVKITDNHQIPILLKIKISYTVSHLQTCKQTSNTQTISTCKKLSHYILTFHNAAGVHHSSKIHIFSLQLYEKYACNCLFCMPANTVMDSKHPTKNLKHVEQNFNTKFKIWKLISQYAS